MKLKIGYFDCILPYFFSEFSLQRFILTKYEYVEKSTGISINDDKKDKFH